jgi:polysaccharide deacetylase family protein (PEP-CTERM system associated)
MRPTHLFSVDVEDYFQVSAFERIAPTAHWNEFPSRVEANTYRLLELLARHGANATFFTLGWVADRCPELVRAIAAAGHEVASHSYWHRRITTLTANEFREDLRRSKQLLEDLVGQPIVGFRAPSFSIVPGVEWAWDVLVEEGFTYDSSVFPIVRPGYGNPSAPRDPYVISTPSGPLRQYPLATASVGALRLPAAGGAYLRLLPQALLHRALREAEERRAPAMCYIHPWEIDPEQPRLKVGVLTRIRHYGGLRTAWARLDALLATSAFTSVRDYCASAPEMA